MISGNRINSRTTCELKAEFIKFSSRKNVFGAKSINFSQNGLGLVSRTAVKAGSHLIVRMLEFPSPEMRTDKAWIRATGIAEVRWINEVVDDDGLSYTMGVRYVHTD
jgi:hypothetical protein